MPRVRLPSTATTEQVEELRKYIEDSYAGQAPVTVEHDERGHWLHASDEQEAAAWAETVRDFFKLPN